MPTNSRGGLSENAVNAVSIFAGWCNPPLLRINGLEGISEPFQEDAAKFFSEEGAGIPRVHHHVT